MAVVYHLDVCMTYVFEPVGLPVGLGVGSEGKKNSLEFGLELLDRWWC